MRIRKWLQAGILLFLGLYFLDNMLTGRIYFYINERFGWLSWMGTALFLALGVMGIADLLRTQQAAAAHVDDHDAHDHAEHDHAEHEHDAHDHGHNHDHAPSWLKLAIVGFPLLVGLLIPAKPLGAAAISNSGVSTGITSVASGSQSSAAQFNIAPTDRNVLDWIRAFNESNDVKEFVGQPADLIGFVYRDIRFDGKPQFMVARFAISCCVADATALGVIVQTTAADKWTQDTWVHVTGKFDTQLIDSRQTPVLLADSVTQVAQPERPYLYP